jgi:DNA-binding transcriptional ArsR family regulator
MLSSGASRDIGERLLSFLWEEWAHIGLSAAVTKTELRVVDPEALIVTTLAMQSEDPRLFDELLDWLALNGRLISTQRLANLTRGDVRSRALVDASLAWAGAHNPSLHGWKTRAVTRLPMDEVLQAKIFVKRPDPILFASGIDWPEVRPSGKSFAPDHEGNWAAFGFRLRHFFGLGTRAEVVRFLFTSYSNEGPVTANRVAEATAFSKRNTHEALVGLEEAGAVSSDRQGNEFRYSLDLAGWADLFDLSVGTDAPEFLDWVAVRYSIVPLISWLRDNAAGESSEYMIASRAQDLLDEIGPFLGRLGIEPGPRRRVDFDSPLSRFNDTTERLLTTLESFARSR